MLNNEKLIKIIILNDKEYWVQNVKSIVRNSKKLLRLSLAIKC